MVENVFTGYDIFRKVVGIVGGVGGARGPVGEVDSGDDSFDPEDTIKHKNKA